MDHQPYNPLHGLTLKTIVTQLVEHFGFAYLGKEIKIRDITSHIKPIKQNIYICNDAYFYNLH